VKEAVPVSLRSPGMPWAESRACPRSAAALTIGGRLLFKGRVAALLRSRILSSSVALPSAASHTPGGGSLVLAFASTGPARGGADSIGERGVKGDPVRKQRRVSMAQVQAQAYFISSQAALQVLSGSPAVAHTYPCKHLSHSLLPPCCALHLRCQRSVSLGPHTGSSPAHSYPGPPAEQQDCQPGRQRHRAG